MDAQKSKQVVLDFFQSMNEGEFEKSGQFFAEDATMWVVGSMPFSGTMYGRQEILEKNFLPSKEFTVPGSASVELGDVIAEGDKVAAEWIFRRKMTSGKDYENYFFGLFSVKNGKIQTFREYLDTHYAQKMLWGD